ncbi:MAG: hypothetical protein LBR11_11840 [Deltaproteobacteria bacterium]|jgi:hypothetical protein|nr:hypothetical protein [Deltaproteobacteria bacterium]
MSNFLYSVGTAFIGFFLAQLIWDKYIKDRLTKPTDRPKKLGRPRVVNPLGQS